MRYGDDSSDCSAVNLQFDAGRGMALRLWQVNLDVGQRNAIFFTHMHSEWEELMGGLRQRARRSYAHADLDRQFNDIDPPMHQPSRSQQDAFMSSDKIAYLHQLGFADPVKMITSFPEIAGLASDNVRRKIADLRELGFADPIKMITYFPPILGLGIDNIRGRIADLRELGFSDPVKMVTLNPAILGLGNRQHPRQDRRPARARLLRPSEDGDVKPGDLGPRNRQHPRQDRHLRELGFSDPVKMITSLPAILGHAMDNIRGKIANLRELGFSEPGEDDHLFSDDPGPDNRKYPQQNR